VLAARIHLCRGSPMRALQTLESLETRFTSPGMEGENFATQGFALACAGRIAEAGRLLAASEDVTSHLEARVLRGFAKAVASYFERDDGAIALDLLTAALREAQETGNLDAFVYAYRSFPPLLQRLPDVKELDTAAFFSLALSLDPALAESAGIGPPSTARDRSAEPLTQREEEVLALVRQGLTNREIAHSLWIAESTVKAHIHHVLQKLGARSRTEAVALSRNDP
jgi:LuxR family maltose regulon positive regulatory protein